MFLRFPLILFFLLFTVTAWPQSNKKGRNKAIIELSKSLEKEQSDEELAHSYELAAKEQLEQGEYAKAEEFLNKAKTLYVKSKNKEKTAAIDRELAKIQESQNRFKEAISNYSSASQLSSSKVQQAINANDMQRVMNNTNPSIQKKYVKDNIRLLDSTDNVGDKVVAYRQMADINLQMDNKDEAITNLNTALEASREPLDIVKINRQIANIYVENKEFDKAVDINQKLVTEAKKTNDTKLEIEQLRSLSSVYFEDHNEDKGITSLQESYALALGKGHTMEAKKSLELLVDRYKKTKSNQEVLDLYADFMDRLETLIKSDSSLIDSKLLRINENKITQLEKERVLKDELIRKKNILNYVLIGSIILILISFIFIIKTLYSIKRKNKKIALQSLRREMNPHFIFNSLNSVNQFIAQNNELEANKYLSSYSKLMRNIMENSNKDFIPLSTEIEQMKEYLELEYIRFHDKFIYRISVDDNLDVDAILIPNMLIQPQLENAIWHGLRYKDTKGLLCLTIKKGDYNHIVIVIEDDGIGLKKSEELKTKHQKSHKSRGLTNTHERINLLNNLYGCNISIKIFEKTESGQGVVVTIKIPLTLKKTN